MVENNEPENVECYTQANNMWRERKNTSPKPREKEYTQRYGNDELDSRLEGHKQEDDELAYTHPYAIK